MVDLDTEREALSVTRERLLNCAHVVAVGIGYKVSQGQRTTTPAVICSVTRKRPRSDLAAVDLVPATINGVETDVVETGVIRALQERTGRHRPAPGGVSIGHRDITAGTLGCLVRKNNQVHILSNNHVLANSNEAHRGDPILQPGPADGGTPAEDPIADLTAFVPIEFEDAPSDCPFAQGVTTLLNAGCRLIGSRTRYYTMRQQQEDNLVDAAIALPRNPEDIDPEILEVGRIQGQAQGELGTAIQKSGRTTGLTMGEIEQVDVTVNVQFGDGRTARFADQLLAGPMSQGGDSGSAVLDNDNDLVGLLFAGSDNSTIINRIEHVFEALDVTL